MACPFCTYPLQSEAKYCPHCGVKVPSTSDTSETLENTFRAEEQPREEQVTSTSSPGPSSSQGDVFAAFLNFRKQKSQQQRNIWSTAKPANTNRAAAATSARVHGTKANKPVHLFISVFYNHMPISITFLCVLHCG